MSGIPQQSTRNAPLPESLGGLSWWSSSGKPAIPFGELVTALIPLLFLALIWISFWISPNFYFTFLLEENNREYQIIEILTFVAGAIAGLVLVYVAFQFWVIHRWEAAVWVGIMALATIFFAGEEISWGQSYLAWETPEWWGEYISRETNFHNSRADQANHFRLTQWGGIFLLVMFVVAPIVWVYQDRLGLSLNLAPAMPDFGSMVTIVVASLYRESKGIFQSLLPSGQIYEDFLWGISEHREMLVAIGLLIYALSRWKVLKKLRKTARVPNPLN